ncbi:MAG TPA: phage major capsid protein [Phycisphaerales bacterium]|nr:phage major capsid protein [Phycisphaerales bacterium]
MGATDLAAISAALSLVFPDRITNQINRKVVLPMLLPVVVGAGKVVAGTAKFTGATNAAASAEGVARSATDADQEVKVNWSEDWAQYDKVASVTDLAAAAVASNLNPGSVGARGADLLAGEVGDMGVRVMMGVASDMYGGDPGATPTELAGAALAIDSSGTFQGINPATYTEWASTEASVALADISLEQIREDLLTPIYDACSEKPDLLTCPSNVFDKIRGLFSDREVTLRAITTARGTIKLQAGIDAIELDGIPVVRDPQCTANTLYAWNTNYVQVEQLLPPELAALFGADRPREALVDFLRMINDDPKLVIPDAVLDGLMARPNTLMPCVKVLGPRGLSTEAMVYIHAQLAWAKRSAFGKVLYT